MTDKEIIKALECIASKKDVLCKNCTYNKYHLMECHRTASKDAIDLINRQQAEIERLQTENNQFADIGKMYSEIKTEAIKEFAERLCEGGISNDPVVIAVKAELKEMVGEDK